ncbi:hypothetical protein D3C78_1511810 [compost metagenome]
MRLEEHVIDVVVVVALTVAIAVDPRIQQRHADTVVGGAAQKRRVDMLPATVLGGFQGRADFTRGFFRDRPGHEVDHPANVLRSVTHGAGPSHHINAVQVAGRNRCHGQLRLAVRRKRGRYAINQYGGTR